MTRTGHRIVRCGAALVAAGVAIAALLHRNSAPEPPPPVIAIRIIPATSVAPFSEPLFANPQFDAVPTRLSGGLPLLMAIVGRLSEPLVMVRQVDGAVRSIGQGETVDGWTLGEVAADRVTFKRGNERRVAVLPPRDVAQ